MKKFIKKFVKKFIRNIMIIIILLVLLITAVYTFRVQLMQAVIERKGSSLNGAVVEIEGLANPVFTLELTWDKLQVTDKKNYMKNAYEINNASFKMIPKPLLAGKFLIEELNVGEVLLDTDRTESGELAENLKPKEKVETDKKNKEESKLSKDIKEYFGGIAEEKKEEALAFDDFDDKNFNKNLENEFDIKLQEEYGEAEQKVKSKEEYWNNLIAERDYGGKISQLEEELNKIDVDTSKLSSLFNNIKDLKSLKEFEKELKRLEGKKEEVGKVVDNGREIVDTINDDKKKLEKDIDELTAIKNNLAKSAEEDLNNIKAVGDFNREELEALSQRLFGGKASKLIFKLTDIYNKITSIFGDKKEKSAAEKNKKESMPELPRLWIKKTTVKVLQNGAYFDGIITDISDNQNKTQNPIVITMTNTAGEKITTLDSIIDFRGDANLKKIEINQEGIILKDESLGFADVDRADAVGDSHIIMDHDKFSMMLNVEMFNIVFAELKDSGDEITQKLIEEVVKDIEKITLNLGYENNNFVLDSNLTDIFSDKLDKIYKEELKKAEEKLRKEMNKKIAAYRASFDEEINKLEKNTGALLSEDQKKAIESFKGISDVEKRFNNELTKLEKEKTEKLNQEEEKARKELEAKMKAEEEKAKEELEKKLAEEKAKLKAEEDAKKKELLKKAEEEAKKLIKF